MKLSCLVVLLCTLNCSLALAGLAETTLLERDDEAGLNLPEITGEAPEIISAPDSLIDDETKIMVPRIAIEKRWVSMFQPPPPMSTSASLTTTLSSTGLSKTDAKPTTIASKTVASLPASKEASSIKTLTSVKPTSDKATSARVTSVKPTSVKITSANSASSVKAASAKPASSVKITTSVKPASSAKATSAKPTSSVKATSSVKPSSSVKATSVKPISVKATSTVKPTSVKAASVKPTSSTKATSAVKATSKASPTKAKTSKPTPARTNRKGSAHRRESIADIEQQEGEHSSISAADDSTRRVHSRDWTLSKRAPTDVLSAEVKFAGADQDLRAPGIIMCTVILAVDRGDRKKVMGHFFPKVSNAPTAMGPNSAPTHVQQYAEFQRLMRDHGMSRSELDFYITTPGRKHANMQQDVLQANTDLIAWIRRDYFGGQNQNHIFRNWQLDDVNDDNTQRYATIYVIADLYTQGGGQGLPVYDGKWVSQKFDLRTNLPIGAPTAVAGRGPAHTERNWQAAIDRASKT